METHSASGQHPSPLDLAANNGERHCPNLDPESPNHYRHLTAYHFSLPDLAGEDVLDYGCGTGYGANLCWRKARPKSMIAVDPSWDAVTLCRSAYPDLADRFRHIAADSVPFPDGTFSRILLFQVIEHIADDARLLRELARVLRPGGKVYLTTPNVELTGEDPDHPANPHHFREYTRAGLGAVCRTAFSQVDELGVVGSFRAGGRGVGVEKRFWYRVARKLLRPMRTRPLYVPPISLSDFQVVTNKISQALDLLFICRR